MSSFVLLNQNTTVRKKIFGKKLSKKNDLRSRLGCLVRKVSCLRQIDAYHHYAVYTYRNKCIPTPF